MVWNIVRRSLGAAVPGVDRYVQNIATASLGLVDIHDSRRAFHGYACVSSPDRHTFQSSLDSPEWPIGMFQVMLVSRVVPWPMP